MKLWHLLIWVTQFGFSISFPLCFFLLLASWLQETWGLGMWVTAVCGLLGLLTTVSTVRASLRSLRKEAEKAGSQEDPFVTFNDHD